MIPRHWLHYQLAQFRLALRRPERAVRAYALEANPRYALAAACLGFLHATHQRKIIQRVSEFDPQVTKQLMRETGLLPSGVEPTQGAEAARQ